MHSSERRQAIIVLDFGSQYSRLITRRVRECQVYSELVPAHTTLTALQQNTHLDIKGFILSGGPSSVYDENAPICDPAILHSGLPVLGICYGMQLVALQLGGHVAPAHGLREYGPATIEVTSSLQLSERAFRIFEGISVSPAQTEHLDPSQASPPLRLPVWMSHGDSVDQLPAGFSVLACTESNPVAAIANDEGMVGLQFHPEVTHTPQGKEIIRNFLFRICGCEPGWTAGSMIEESVELIRTRVGQERVICGLSGGVDSAVAALLVHRAVGEQLTCVFVDTGLLRASEREQVVDTFGSHLHIPLVVVDARSRFLARLADVLDPEEKRKIIGEEFIRVFEEEALRLEKDLG
ncbi:MAG: glutamine-hydrolyzing GMP synthase, partial [Ktedonobacteraceae bacterium]|nr:glutamine-hydrolyzing GMP synthase [Ktedonobacteraceae bacterium]